MKILNLALNTILILLIAGVVAFIAAPRFGFVNPYEIKIVRSGSMEPAIKTGGIVIIHPEPSYKVGDVITFGADTRTSVPTTHRIISTRNEGKMTYFYTKGDANEDSDASETLAESVIGKVIFTLPYVGYIFAFAKTPPGFMTLIAIPAALIMLYEAIGIYTEVTAMRRKKKDAVALSRLAKEARETNPLRLQRQRPLSSSQFLHFDIEMPYREHRYRAL